MSGDYDLDTIRSEGDAHGTNGKIVVVGGKTSALAVEPLSIYPLRVDTEGNAYVVVNDGSGNNALGAILGGDDLSGTYYGPIGTFGHVFDGTNWDRIRGAKALDSGATAGVLAAHKTGLLNTSGTLTSLQDTSVYANRTTSAADTAQAITVDMRNLKKSLAIHSAASAGTADLTIAVSVDNTNYLTLEVIAAGATVVKQYTETTVGATIALSPLSFRYVKITAGTAGGGNTTTLTISAK